jgi:GcrA cell cycle regulator
MQADNWAPEHCQALRDYLALGMSFAEIAREINTKFGTAYTRNAALGRSKRMGLSAPERPEKRPKVAPPGVRKPRERNALREPVAAVPLPERAPPVKLRCVGVSPRLVSLIELEASDCRYPYGGDKENEPITFCGHPRLASSSYCAPHFYLTRTTETQPERVPGPVVLRLVQAA